MRFLGGLFVMGYVCSGGVAQAATYHVSTNGSDGRSCSQAQSASTPKLTINNAVNCLGAGDTLYVRGGVYDESLTATVYSDHVASGTSWSRPVRIAAYPGDSAVWLRPSSMARSAGGFGFVIWFDANVSYVEFDGINLDGSNLPGPVFWMSTNNGNNPHHIRFQNAEIIGGSGSAAGIMLGAHTFVGAIGSHEIINVTIHGGGLPGLCGYRCAWYGLYVMGPNNLIQGCDIYDTGGAGIHIYNPNGDAPDNNVIRNNRIHDITRAGSLDEVWGILDLGSSNQIYNNVIYGIRVGNVNQGNAGIAVGGTSEVYNNTVYGNNGWGISVGFGLPTYAASIRNNISYGNRLGQYGDYGIGTYQSDNLFTDPHFVNPGGGDFSLRSDSPAIDRGAHLPAVPFDYSGVSRPQGNGYDIGAFEFGSGTPGPPPAPSPGPGPDPSGSASPDGTRVPQSSSSIVDNNLAVWTLGSGEEILRNGVQVARGYGSQILWYQGTIYVLGDDNNWWRWNNGWLFNSSSDPAGGANASTVSASGTRVP